MKLEMINQGLEKSGKTDPQENMKPVGIMNTETDRLNRLNLLSKEWSKNIPDLDLKIEETIVGSRDLDREISTCISKVDHLEIIDPDLESYQPDLDRVNRQDLGNQPELDLDLGNL